MSTMNTSRGYKLEACPFCGGDAEVHDIEEGIVANYSVLNFFVQCKVCWVQTRGFKTGDKSRFTTCEREAVSAWNRRPGTVVIRRGQ